MIESQKSHMSIQYRMQFWVLLEKLSGLSQYMTLKNTSDNVIKKVLICLENGDIEKAAMILQKAKKRMLPVPEVTQLEALIGTNVNPLN